MRSLFLVALTCVASLSARAQEDSFTLPVERFRPTIDDKGLGTTEGGAIPGHLAFQTGVVLNYALNPLVLRDGDGNFIAGIIAHRVAANAQFTIGLFEYVSLGADLPVTLLQLPGEVSGQLENLTGLDQGLAGIGVGDLKLVPKVRVLREDRHFVSLALIPAITLPTAGGVKFLPAGPSFDYGGSYLGEGPFHFAFMPEVALSRNLFGFRLAGNLAYRLRQPVKYLGALDINPELVYRGGVGYDFSTLTTKLDGLMLWGEVFGATPDRNPFGLIHKENPTDAEKRVEDATNRLTNPLEWDVGVRYTLPLNIKIEGGFGSGILPGYGSPDFRLFGGIRYGQEDNDKDDDGVLDADDKCIDDPEDKDAFQDSDGCPDPDNDGDGIPDAADKCPNEAEDVDAWKDDDGCAEPDNDQDGVLDADDKCPVDAGLAKYAGCPMPDRDGDGVGDDDDKCKDEPGVPALAGCPDKDKDGTADLDDTCPEIPGPVELHGCPDKDGDRVLDMDDKCPDVPGVVEFAGCPDTDKDGIPDNLDKCPTEPETINGIDDTDGCPDKGKILVVVTKEKIEIKDTIYFDSGKDTIQKKSFSLLDQIAQVMKAHPEITKVSVEGHTDDQGSDVNNLDLSKRRARSVVTYLTTAGVDAGRMVSDGHGESKPIADNKTKDGRAKNRRVEFLILEQH